MDPDAIQISSEPRADLRLPALPLRKIKELRPEMAILLISGYPLEYLDDRGLIDRQSMAAPAQAA
jgi:hypothetical protein